MQQSSPLKLITEKTKIALNGVLQQGLILVPIALSFLLAGLARENKGLWGHRIFELIRFFLLAVWNKKFLNGSRKRNDSLVHFFET